MAGPKEFPINLSVTDQAFLKDIRKIVDRKLGGSLKPKGADAKIRERIGERTALNRVRGKFPGADPIVIARRGSKGAPVLDLLLRTSDGKFIIVEAKYSTAGKLKLGATNAKAFLVTSRGLVPVKVKGGTQQMSPRWIQDRIRELQRLGKHKREFRILAGQLQHALHSGRFEAYAIVTDSTGEFRLEKNYTQEWKNTFTSKGTEVRPQSSGRVKPFARPQSPGQVKALPRTPILDSERGIANRISPRTIRKSVRRAVISRGLRSASLFVVKRLVSVISKALPILEVIDFALILLSLESARLQRHREKAIERALRRWGEVISKFIHESLEKNQDKIARDYVAQGDRNIPSSLFLYLSPRVELHEIIHNRGGFKHEHEFRPRFEVNDLAKDLISTEFIKPSNNVIKDSAREYAISLRSSVPQPLFTPFDIFLVRIELIAETVVDDWFRLYSEQTSVSPNIVRTFHNVIKICARITATLKYDAYYGYSLDVRKFLPDLAGWERFKHLQKLMSVIRYKLIPKLDYLLQKRQIDQDSRKFVFPPDAFREEVELSVEGHPLVESLQQLVDVMSTVTSQDLAYTRFETLKIEQKPDTTIDALLGRKSIDPQTQKDLATFLGPVEDFLPESLKRKQVAPLSSILEETGEITIGLTNR